jgi:hypothetical protein
VIRLDHVVLLLPARTVLGAEEHLDLEVGVEERIGGETQIRRHRCRVQDQPQTFAPKVWTLTGQKHIEARHCP